MISLQRWFRGANRVGPTSTSPGPVRPGGALAFFFRRSKPSVRSAAVYDDLIGPSGKVVERVSTPWTRDSRTLAALRCRPDFRCRRPPGDHASGSPCFLDGPRQDTQPRLLHRYCLRTPCRVGTSIVVSRKRRRPSGIALAHTVPSDRRPALGSQKQWTRAAGSSSVSACSSARSGVVLTPPKLVPDFIAARFKFER